MSTAIDTAKVAGRRTLRFERFGWSKSLAESPLQGEIAITPPFPRPSAWSDRNGLSGRKSHEKSFAALPGGPRRGTKPFLGNILRP